MRVRNSIWIALALGLAGASQVEAAPISNDHVDAPSLTANAPEWERQLIDVFLDTRKQYETHGTVSAGALRMSQQAGVERLMKYGRHVQNWIGKVHAIEKDDDGNFMLSVEIAPQVTIATWPNKGIDNREGTLISPNSPLYKTVSDLQFEQKIMFDALIVAGRSAPDREMVESPQLIATFTAITPLGAKVQVKHRPLDRFDTNDRDVPASTPDHAR